MKTLSLAPLAAGLMLAFSANAQDHSQHHMPAKQDHSQQQPVEHSQHQQDESESKAVDHAAMGHTLPAAPEETVDHAAMGHAPPHSPDQPITPIPVLTDADRAAAIAPPDDHPVHDNAIQSFVLFNRLEAFDSDEGNGLGWEGQAWIGTDLDRIWLRSEGERVDGHTEAADIEVLYGRPIARWWDVVAGVRHDFQPGGSQDFAAIGVMGLAPYKFEVEATAYIGESGQTAARVELEYETLLTNRLILQPLVEANFHGRNDERRGIGSGLSTIEAGLRLRYEVTRQFAPYIGVMREKAFGRTADYQHEDGDTRVVAGVRAIG
jgi:copper resistance protein B